VTVRKAVLPVAGYGTRFLPASKAVPKEMLPLVDRPAIQYVVEECARAGLDDVLLVTSMGKSALEDHFDRRLDLESALEAKGKDDVLAEVRAISDIAEVSSVRQHEQLGLGHAVLMGRQHVGDEPFVVVLGDDIVDPSDHYLERMLAVHEASGRPTIALMEVPEDQTHMYGIATVEETDDEDVVAITGMVEKPEPGTAPSNLAIIGRYVLPAEIFEVLEQTPRGAGGEIQLTDALVTLAEQEPLRGVVFRGVRHDVGDKLGFLKATVHLALEREDLGPDFRAWLTSFLADRADVPVGPQ
jgi:UTP--glucose-1-phosphate uridylyltransferase